MQGKQGGREDLSAIEIDVLLETESFEVDRSHDHFEKMSGDEGLGQNVWMFQMANHSGKGFALDACNYSGLLASQLVIQD